MKTKKTKLTLKKDTIANLNDLKLANVYGGNETDITCFCTVEYTDCKQCQIEPGNTDDGCTYGWSLEGACFTKTSCRCTTYCTDGC
jgi:hypothetical protein